MELHTKIYRKLMLTCPNLFGKIISILGKKRKNDIELFEKIKENKKYKNIHCGKRCFIVGNGPSIKLQDLSLLHDEYVFTVNQIARNPQFDSINTNYHFWADPIFFDIDLHEHKNEELYNVMKAVRTENNSPIVFYPSNAQKMIKETCLDDYLDINYFLVGDNFDADSKKDINFANSIGAFHTVVQYAISMAIYMGFSEIYFIGCESTGIISNIERRIDANVSNTYAYELTENEKERMANARGQISYEIELYDNYMIMRGYRHLSEYCENRGIKLRNCTPGGLIDSVKRQKFEELFDNKK